MRRFSVALLLAVLVPIAAHAAPCQQYVVPYNTATTVSFCLQTYDSGASDDNAKLSLKTNATFAAGDLKVNLDHAGEANIGTLPTDRGNCYDVPLSTGETTGKEGYVTLVDQSAPKVWVDTCLEYRTSGNASAFYPLAAVNVSQWGGTNIATPDTAGYPKVTIKDGTGTGEIDTNAGAVVAVTTATTCTTASTCSALGATAKTDVKTQVTDGLNVDTYAELTACPADTTTMTKMVRYLYEFFRHKVTATSTVQTLFKDDASTALCTNTMSDDGTTFSKGEFN